jgi:hypothetical protein
MPTPRRVKESGAVSMSRFYIEAPAIKPLPYGLLSVADVTEAGNGNWMNGVEFEPLCGPAANVATQPCDTQPGTNEVQTITINGNPTGGTFTITAYGETTAPIAYSADGPTVEAALNTLRAFRPGDITVTGPNPIFTLTFGGNYAKQNVEQITVAHALTGGTSPSATVATTTPGVRTPKTVTAAAGTIEVDPITVYSLYGCRSVGDIQRSKQRAVDLLNIGEGRALEEGFWKAALAGGADVQDLSGASAVSAEAGLAILEAFAAENYGGTPVIHATRDIASIIATRGGIARHGKRMESHLGSLVAAGGGYAINTGPGASAAPAGESWMYATGHIQIMRGTATVQGPLMRTIDGDNETVSLAERTFVAMADCFVAAIKVDNPS